MGAREVLIIENEAPLSRIGTGGMQADNRRALSVFLEIDTLRDAVDVEVGVTPRDGFDPVRHVSAP